MRQHHVSPPDQSAKRVFPEKFAAVGGASQEKRHTNPEAPGILFSSPTASVVDCKQVAFGKSSEKERVSAISACIRTHYGDALKAASEESKLSSELILAVLIAESAGNPYAVSKSGCKGFMQLLTSTAESYGVPHGKI